MIGAQQGKTAKLDFQLVQVPKNAYQVERIVNKKLRKFRGKVMFMYEVKWKNYPQEQNTWEPIEHLSNVMDLVKDFQARRAIQKNENKNLLVKEEQLSQSSSNSFIKTERTFGKNNIQIDSTPCKMKAKASYSKQENLKNLLSKYPKTKIMNHIVSKGIVFYEISLYDSNNILKDRLIVSSEELPNSEYTPQLIQYLQDFFKDVQKYSSDSIKS